METRWECRYSSSEILYLEIASGSHVKTYLDHSPGDVELTSFDDVLAGKMDGEASSLFGAAAVDELKSTVRQIRSGTAPKPETKQQAMLRRRREG
ncbi:hypothetical protein BH10PLA1_BH10PLA1_02320 [soil metagenome]